MNKQKVESAQVEKVLPNWPEFRYDPEEGTIRLSGLYRSPRFFEGMQSVAGTIGFIGLVPWFGLLAALSRDDLTRYDIIPGLAAWAALVVAGYLWLQYRVLRSKVDIEVTREHVRIGKKLYDIESVVSIDWDIHEDAYNPDLTPKAIQFFRRCYQVTMLYGVRTVEVAAIFKGRKKAESLALTLQSAMGLARAGKRPPAQRAPVETAAELPR